MESISLFAATATASLMLANMRQYFTKSKKIYHGSCHCKAVTFDVSASIHLIVWNCNCSICYMKKNYHFIVPEDDFKLLSGKDDLTEYRFNTKVARHMFCKVCGVQAYYKPRSNPDGVAVTLACINPDEVRYILILRS